jgi:hypothetical protein
MKLDPNMQLELRDFFAAAALKGILASNRVLDLNGEMVGINRARLAYALADAMLEVRKVCPTTTKQSA